MPAAPDKAVDPRWPSFAARHASTRPDCATSSRLRSPIGSTRRHGGDPSTTSSAASTARASSWELAARAATLLVEKRRSGDHGSRTRSVLTTVNELRDRGITVVSLTENFDLGTKEGRFMFAVLAAAAEYELELRAERQAEGIAAAKRREATGAMLPGKKKTGRPRVIGPAELATLRRLVDDGISVTEAARTLKIGRSTAYAALVGR
ncbi:MULTISPECIES: recombinase family protein [unclassified Nonomuraea]|uniref:recombinase family protein n=1 Tax=unclassified Nonomuraea TaxID=2593643 RepID=UPI003402F2AF